MMNVPKNLVPSAAEGIARVFPRRTNMTPTDENAFVGEPPLGCPHFDEVHISVTFTWDIERGQQLIKEWSKYGKRIFLGGPIMGDIGYSFTPGMYIKKGVTFTSRGCPNFCSYCLVPKREGGIRELPIMPGRIVQDNNLLACSKPHIQAVFEMLKSQHRIEFAGGLQADLITERIAQQLSRLSIRHLWLSYDRPDDPEKIRQAVKVLQKYGFKRDQIRCYVLIAMEGDTLTKAESRLKEAWRMGTLPFAMRYRKPAKNFADSFVYRDREWNLLTRKWSRPAAIKAMMIMDACPS